ncbi:MAG: efflux RND transporter periplasmic adaptor subunit [Nitrospira sp.]|nr:efflux RND transporter periplasmic adaptor subunit [Candidatus Manganitrophaceae bacterium]HIL34364.1 efflux RND transporter periplasmic adaptor subunit [Candidatus Manganitrophaceae bacterium]
MGSKRLHKILTFIVVFLLLAVLIYAFRKGDREEVRHRDLVLVKKGDVVVKAAETGSLEPANVVEIKSEQAGEVKQLFVQGGDGVKVGQALATIQPESNQARKVAEAQASIEQEQLNLKENQREVHRMKTLYTKGFIAQKLLEDAEKGLENSKIRLNLAKRKLLLTLDGDKALFDKYFNRDLKAEALDDYTLFSPISGTVLEVNVAVGEIVSSGTSTITGGTALLRIADLSKMWVKTKINEVNINRIREGQPVVIHLDAIPFEVYEGRVARISPKGEKEDDVVTYEVTVELANIDQRLMPSMTANVDIITQIEKNVLYLPLSALKVVDGKATVTVRKPTGEDQLLTVTIGIKNETVAVIMDGLNEGDQIVLPIAKEGQGRRGA